MQSSFLTILLLAFASSSVTAQLPEKAEDVSPLLIGETFPDQQLTDMENQQVSLLEVVKKKPTVLVFYRGGWCPYCNAHLSALGQNEAEILGLGYQVVAISPDAAKGLQETVAKDEIKYRLLSDASGDLAKAVGVAFKAPEKYGQHLLDASGGKNTGFLPVPSVFVLDTSGSILFEYINPDYKKRLDGELLLAVLRALKANGK